VVEDVLGGYAGDKASYYFDDPWILELLASWLPETYCYCEG
jgi:hypothetical protein